MGGFTGHEKTMIGSHIEDLRKWAPDIHINPSLVTRDDGNKYHLDVETHNALFNKAEELAGHVVTGSKYLTPQTEAAFKFFNIPIPAASGEPEAVDAREEGSGTIERPALRDHGEGLTPAEIAARRQEKGGPDEEGAGSASEGKPEPEPPPDGKAEKPVPNGPPAGNAKAPAGRAGAGKAPASKPGRSGNKTSSSP